MLACDACGAPVRKDRAHRFERPDRTPLASYCDNCCPRCNADPGDVA
jgi:hypothetical protein